MSAAGGWLAELRTGRADELHGPWPGADDTGDRRVARCQVTEAAVVIGSTQRAPDPDRAGPVPVVRRRAGGGAVVVAPGAQVWVDLWLPRGDPRWDDDVGRAAGWVGDAWSAALVALGVPRGGLRVHRGALRTSRWSGRVCFAGLGPGEVTSDGRKVVGIAQRRTRAGARFHTMALLHWDVAALTSRLHDAGVLAPTEVPAAAGDLRDAAAGLRALVGAPWTGAPDDDLEAAVVRALVAALPAP